MNSLKYIYAFDRQPKPHWNVQSVWRVMMKKSEDPELCLVAILCAQCVSPTSSLMGDFPALYAGNHTWHPP